MPRIHPVDPATATGETAAQLATARRMFGATINLVTTAANAPATLGAMLDMFANMGKASLGPKIGEQIAIAVAQSNGCGYCLSAHTAIGKMHGLDAAELAAARRAAAGNARTAAILRLAVDINQSRGQIGDAALAHARQAGITDAEIVEIVGHVALNVFTNYLNNVSGTVIDFPVVALDSAA
jgi:uncharacterized peroxidase-related enzyme